MKPALQISQEAIAALPEQYPNTKDRKLNNKIYLLKFYPLLVKSNKKRNKKLSNSLKMRRKVYMQVQIQ